MLCFCLPSPPHLIYLGNTTIVSFHMHDRFASISWRHSPWVHLLLSCMWVTQLDHWLSFPTEVGNSSSDFTAIRSIIDPVFNLSLMGEHMTIRPGSSNMDIINVPTASQWIQSRQSKKMRVRIVSFERVSCDRCFMRLLFIYCI